MNIKSSKNKILVYSLIVLWPFFDIKVYSNEEKAVYGIDNRRDLYQITNPQWLKNARAIAALVPKRKLKKISGRSDLYKLKTKKVDDNCSFQRYNEQRQVAKCSGFLVGKDLLVTAAHCIRTRLGCLTNRWVFGFGTYVTTTREV